MSGSLCLTIQAKAFLGDQGWMYEVFICHTGADMGFAKIVCQEIQKCGLKTFLCQESVETGDSIQLSIAHAIISAAFCVVVLIDSFMNQQWRQEIVSSCLLLTLLSVLRSVLLSLLTAL